MSPGSSLPEVVVLGGGVAGLTIAWELLQRGVAVTVLRPSDRRPPTSLVAAGILAPMAETALNPAIGRLASEALHGYPAFLEALATDSDAPTGFEQTGVLRPAYSPAEAEALREGVGAYEAAGVPSQWLSPADCIREVPGIGAGLVGGLLTFDEAQVQAEWLMLALADAVARRGGRFVDGEAASVEASGAGVEVRLGPGSGPALRADRAVLAMGSWSATLPGLDYPVRPVKGQLLVFPAGSPAPRRILYAGHSYLLGKADGTVILGGTVEERGFDTETDAGAEGLREVLPRLFPALAGAPATARAGLRPSAPDGLPVVGALGQLPAAYVFTAHFRNGFLLSPLTARLAADEIMGLEVSDMLRPLRPRRLLTASGLGGTAAAT